MLALTLLVLVLAALVSLELVATDELSELLVALAESALLSALAVVAVAVDVFTSWTSVKTFE